MMTLPYFSSSILHVINKSRFTVNGFCYGSPTSFSLNEDVDSVKWDFGDTAAPCKILPCCQTLPITVPGWTFPGKSHPVKQLFERHAYSRTQYTFSGYGFFWEGNHLMPWAEINPFRACGGYRRPLYLADQPGRYWVNIRDGSCLSGDTIDVTCLSVAYIFSTKDTTLCREDTLLLNAGNHGANYTCDDNSTSQARVIITPGTYWLQVRAVV